MQEFMAQDDGSLSDKHNSMLNQRIYAANQRNFANSDLES